MEFVVVLPVLVTALLGCIDFGRFAHDYIAVTNAARAGAGFGGDHPYTPATQSVWQCQVRQAVEDELRQLSDYGNSNLAVNITLLPASGPPSQVRVEVCYRFTMLINWPGIPGALTMQRAAVFPVVRP